jgi:hypothetical protein
MQSHAELWSSHEEAQPLGPTGLKGAITITIIIHVPCLHILAVMYLHPFLSLALFIISVIDLSRNQFFQTIQNLFQLSPLVSLLRNFARYYFVFNTVFGAHTLYLECSPSGAIELILA